MNIQTNHKAALEIALTKYDYAPYNIVGEGLEAISNQIKEGECYSYTLAMPQELFSVHSNLHNVVDTFFKKNTKGGIWAGLGETLQDKITSRRRIDYYRLNIKERLDFIDADTNLGDGNGEITDGEIESLFPELSFKFDDRFVYVTLHIPIF